MGSIQKKIGTRIRSLRTPSIIALTFLSLPAPYLNAATAIGGGFDAGATATVSDERTEVSKKGLTYAGYLGALFAPTDSSWLTLALGFQGYAVDGSNGNRTQEVKSRTTVFAADYRYRLWGVEPGLSVRANYGKDSSLRAGDQDKSQMTLNVGPSVAYRWSHEDRDIVGYVAATQDMNVAKEINTSFLVGLQYWIKDKATVTPVPPAEQRAELPDLPVPPSIPLPQPVTESVAETPKFSDLNLRFKPDTFKFEPNSDKLTKASRDAAVQIAKTLAFLALEWSKIEISGHSDGASKNPARNLEVSEQRAHAILKIFSQHGIPAERASAKGYGASQPLQGVDPMAPENRRIELKLSDVKDAREITEGLDKFLSGNK